MVSSNYASEPSGTEVQAVYEEGGDAQSLEKSFVRRFAQSTRLYRDKEDHEIMTSTLLKKSECQCSVNTVLEV